MSLSFVGHINSAFDFSVWDSAEVLDVFFKVKYSLSLNLINLIIPVLSIYSEEVLDVFFKVEYSLTLNLIDLIIPVLSSQKVYVCAC